jgi:hypothetical protein
VCGVSILHVRDHPIRADDDQRILVSLELIRCRRLQQLAADGPRFPG